MMRAKTTLLLLCTLVLCLTGCSRKQSRSEDKRLTIAVIPKGTTHEFWKTVHAGAEKAGQELNVNIIWKGALKEDDREAQISVVENMIIRAVDGIVLAPLDDIALRGPVDQAMHKGIPVLIFDSGLQGDNYVSYVATNNFKGGQLAGRHLAELLNGKGKVVVLRYLEGSDSTTKREDGFLDAINKKYGDIEVVSSGQYAGVTTESALQAGEMSAFVVQNPMQIGYLGVKTVVEHIGGKDVPRRIDTGCTLVTRENLNQPEIHELLHPNLGKWLR